MKDRSLLDVAQQYLVRQSQSVLLACTARRLTVAEHKGPGAGGTASGQVCYADPLRRSGRPWRVAITW